MIACAIAVLRSFIYMSMHGIARESLVCTHTKFFVLKTYDTDRCCIVMQAGTEALRCMALLYWPSY